VVSAFRNVIDGTMTPQQGVAALNGQTRGAPSNGFWHGKAGMAWYGAM
jgi:hypothetical protein